MGIIADNSRAGDEAEIRLWREKSGKALDELWKRSWIRDGISPGAGRLKELELQLSEFSSLCDMIVLVADGSMAAMLRGMLRALTGTGHKKLVVFCGTLSAGSYRVLFQEMEKHSCSMVAFSCGEETLAQRTAFATIRKFLQDRYGTDGAGRRIRIVLNGEARYLAEEASADGHEMHLLEADVQAAEASGTDAMLVPGLLAGADMQAFMEGFRRMLTSTWWDRDADCYSLCLAGHREEDIVYWQREFTGAAEWIATLHKAIGIDARTVFMPREEAALREDAFCTHLFCRSEDSDIMLPPFPGADPDGSLNEMAKSAMEALWRRTTGTKLTLDGMTPGDYGELVCFLQISSGITGFILQN